MSDTTSTTLLTGATGYVGGRLLPLLESRGERVRCLVRRPNNLGNATTLASEIVQGDVLDADSLVGAFEGVDTAYYLVHSMGASGSFEDRDRVAARNFAQAARDAGVRRIIYLGGLGDDDERLSPHLRSRHEVGEVLKE
ncbi:MAG: NAD(P)H-binding protein [Pirellulales bacterium]|nr:NAD(P)H-binding protein [Pirellulales bacterium]